MKALKRNNLFLIVLLFASLFSCRDKGIKNPNFEISDNHKNGGILEISEHGLWVSNRNNLSLRDFSGNNPVDISGFQNLNRASFFIQDSFLSILGPSSNNKYLIVKNNNVVFLRLNSSRFIKSYIVDSVVVEIYNRKYPTDKEIEIKNKNLVFLRDVVFAETLNNKTLFYVSRRNLLSANFNVYPPRFNNNLGFTFDVGQSLYHLNSKDDLIFLCSENQVILLRNNASVVNELSRIL